MVGSHPAGGSQPGRRSSRSCGANHSGRTAVSRRRAVRRAASTPGTGRNAERGTTGPSWNVHQGAHAADRSVVGGTAARFRATSNWMSRSARTGPSAGLSNRLANRAVVSPNGGFETTRYGSEGHSISRKSCRTISTWSTKPASLTLSPSRRAQAGSGSVAMSWAPARTSGRVRAPVPAPTSTIRSPGRTWTASISLLTSFWSTRKFCPSERLRASRGVRRRLADTDDHRHSHGLNGSRYPGFDRLDFCNSSQSSCPWRLREVSRSPLLAVVGGGRSPRSQSPQHQRLLDSLHPPSSRAESDADLARFLRCSLSAQNR